MAGARWRSDADPGGGGMPFRPGDPEGYRSMFEEEDAVWVVVEDVEGSEMFRNLHPRVSYQILKDKFRNVQMDITKMKNRGFLMKIKRGNQQSVCGDKIPMKAADNAGFFVKISVHKNLSQVKGSIWHEDLPLYSESELLEDLQRDNEGVVEVSKTKFRGSDGTLRVSNRVIVTFDLNTLPEFVLLNYLRLPVQRFIPKPLQCRKCFEFGHVSKYCKSANSSQPMCGNCGKLEHLQRNASGELVGKCDHPPSCLNCSGGKHPSWSRECPTYVKEQAIVKIRTIQRVSYKHAAFLYNQQRETKNVRSVRAEAVTTTEKSNTETDRLCIKMTEMTQMIKLLCEAVFALVKGKQPELTQLQDMLEMNETNKKTVKRTRVEEEEDIEEVVEEDMDIGQGGNTTYSARVASQLGNWGPFASSSKEGRTGYYTSSAVGPAVRLKDPG